MIYFEEIHNPLSIYERRKKCPKKLKNKATLARNLLGEICANLIDFLKKILYSPDFVNRNKKSVNNFIRNRMLNFQTLVLYFINLPKGSYKDELDHFFKALFRLDVPVSMVSKMALSLARRKLKYSAFVELNHHLFDFFYKHFKNKKSWHGFNLLAIDGSTLKLLKYKNIREHFGTMKPNNGPEVPMARISQMFDVLNKITIDALIKPYKIGERDLLHEHLIKLLPNDLLLLDRGYPAYWIFNLIISQGGNFCARISKHWKIVQRFIESGAQDTIIDLHASAHSRKECLEMELDVMPLRLRLIRVELESGQIEVLITSLIDEDKFPQEIFKDLYHKRWPIEVDYFFMKERIQIGNLSGQSALSVYQDFHSKVFAKNLTWVLSSPAQDVVKHESEGKKYDYQLNMTQAISKSKDTLFLLFERPRKMRLWLIQQIHNIFIDSTEPIRPGRKFERNHKINKREYYMNNKPCR